MRLSELIAELQKYKIQDAILVTPERVPVGDIILDKHGGEQSRDMFVTLRVGTINYGAYYNNNVTAIREQDNNDDDYMWDNYPTGDPIV